jgi:hypothetical protein
MADSSRTKTRTNKKGAGERRLLIDTEQYERHHIKLAIIMGHFTLRHLNMVYQEFEGDLILPIVLGEIAHHNILKFYSQTGEYQDIERIIATDHDWQRHLEPCNAFSISEATGIPRETVRRKVDKLVKKGWLARNARGEIAITEAVGRHFIPDFNRNLLQELLDTCSQIRSVLESKKPGSPRKKARQGRKGE